MPCIAHTYIGWEDDDEEEHWATIEVEVTPSTTATQIRNMALAQLSFLYSEGGSEALESLPDAQEIEVDITDIYCY